MPDVEIVPSGIHGDAQAIIDAATRAAAPSEVEPGKIYAVALNGGVQTIDLDLDKYRDAPRRTQGSTSVFDAASFLVVYSKHGNETYGEVWADLDAFTVQAVFNAGAAGEPEWRDHRCTLTVRKTKAWLAWEKLNSDIGSQVQFAEHIEDRLIDFTGDPSGAEMLEIAQTFQAHTGVQFESAQRLASGERKLTYREDTAATAGAKGNITIPERFTLALVPFEGSEPYRVTARLRYRIQAGDLRIGYVLDRPEDVLAAAFNDVIDVIRDGVKTPVIAGRP